MLNQDKPDDYLLSSDKTHSIKDFIDLVCKFIDLETTWVLTENPLDATLMYTGKCLSNESQLNPLEQNYKEIPKNIVIVKINPKFFRASESKILCGNSSNTRIKLGWCPKVSFEELVEKMVKYDYSLVINRNARKPNVFY